MKKSNKILSIVLAITLFLSISITTSALTKENENNDVIGSDIRSTEIIGQSENVNKYSLLPNKLNIYWVASSTQVIITVQNVGIDTVDTFKGMVSIDKGVKKPFSTYKLKAFETRNIKVNINMTKCYESITVSYYAKDGNTAFGQGSSPGHREIPSNLSNLWSKGTFKNIYSSINYHFSKHHTEVSANDIVSYATKAKNYRTVVLNDKKKLSISQLKNKYTIAQSSGTIKANKYKSKSNKQFIILTNSGNKILSYGK